MKQNRYTEKFKSKSDKELEYIMNSTDQFYVEEARLAAIYLLEVGNGSSQKLATERIKIQATKEKRETEKERRKAEVSQQVEVRKKKSDVTDDLNAPELHSQTAIAIFSAVFSTIFGTVLLMYNMKLINNLKGRNRVLIFGIIWTIFTITISSVISYKSSLVPLIFNLSGAAILTGYFWNKFIGKEFKYRKRSWIKPAIISVIIMIPFLLAVIYGRSYE